MRTTEIVRVALSGLGGYGSFYLERLLDRADEFGVELVGAIDPKPETCARLKDLQHHGIPVFSNIDELLARQTVDLMVVSSPIHCHAEHSIKAMEAGAHVLCEKPAAGSVAEAEAMAQTSIRTGRFCAIGYQWSFSDAVTRLKKDILAGVFGTPIRFKTLVLWPRPESYYRRCDWAGKAKTADGRWVLDSPVNNACAHFWHNMLFLAGDRPESAGVIESIQGELYRAKPVETFDTAAIRCRMASGLEILLYATHSCQATIGPISTFEFSNAVLDFRADKGFVARLNNGTVHEYGDPDADKGDLKVQASLNAIRHASPVPCDIHSAIPHVKGVAALDPDGGATVTFPKDQIVHEIISNGDTLVYVKGLENTLIQCYVSNILPGQHFPTTRRVMAWDEPEETGKGNRPVELSPSVYEHAARFTGRTPWEVSRDGELLYEAHAAAYMAYHHTPIMPGIDIYNLEPEAYGAVVAKPEGYNIPSIETHPLACVAELLALAPLDPAADGRIAMQIEVARRLKRRFPESDVRVPVCGPFSIASNLLGFDRLLLACAMEPETVARAMLHLIEGQVRFARAIRDAALDVAFFESAACPPMLSPAMFREIELPALKAIMTHFGAVLGHPVPCIIGGNTAPIVDAMLETGSSYLVAPFETDQAAFMAAVADRPDVRIRINMDVRIVASGTHAQLEAEANRALALAGDRRNVCLGTGALPYEADPDNVRYLQEIVACKT